MAKKPLTKNNQIKKTQKNPNKTPAKTTKTPVKTANTPKKPVAKNTPSKKPKEKILDNIQYIRNILSI